MKPLFGFAQIFRDRRKANGWCGAQVFPGELLELFAALGEREINERLAAIVYEKVEDDERGRSVFGQLLDAAGRGLDAHQERVEGELAVLWDDDFAIENKLFGVEREEIIREFGKVTGEGLGGFRHEIDAPAVGRRDNGSRPIWVRGCQSEPTGKSAAGRASIGS